MAFTEEQEETIWCRWRAGDSIRLIGRALACHPDAVRSHLGRSGGVRPRIHRRHPGHLTGIEREEVSRGACCWYVCPGHRGGLGSFTIHDLTGDST